MNCMWCESTEATESVNTVYWELPDGTKAIEIQKTPCISCFSCGMEYQPDHIVKEIEDQLFLIYTKDLPKQLTYEELMERPRLLKRNYFDF
ncbi:YokU family protein [Bacillus cytotoxicus]|uniref:YokU family protein n=1 Tax=Bacillus cereus group sp. BfR-BA-01492 TaxID=2920361 RepID=UPI001F5603C9|nr:YokU family protein [Bacillus cereus group sp. BfR-BA-01492]EMA6344241.1 YokU family protein [Bacillus cytotoxicus]